MSARDMKLVYTRFLRVIDETSHLYVNKCHGSGIVEIAQLLIIEYKLNLLSFSFYFQYHIRI